MLLRRTFRFNNRVDRVAGGEAPAWKTSVRCAVDEEGAASSRTAASPRRCLTKRLIAPAPLPSRKSENNSTFSPRALSSPCNLITACEGGELSALEFAIVF